MEKLGIRVILNVLDGNQRDDATQYAGQFDWLVLRNDPELISVVQNTEQLAPVGPRTSWYHRAGKDGSVDLLPFEKELVDIVNKFIAQPGQRRARRPDEAVPEDLHGERLHRRPDGSIRAR